MVLTTHRNWERGLERERHTATDLRVKDVLLSHKRHLDCAQRVVAASWRAVHMNDTLEPKALGLEQLASERVEQRCLP